MSASSNRKGLSALLDKDLLEAAQICALPHWLDDGLATQLLELAGRNGSSTKLVAQVKRLPIVQPFEATSWRVEEVARDELIEGFRDNNIFNELSEFLAERFAASHDSRADPIARESRVTLWRSAYHYADVDPATAVDRLTHLVTDAARVQRLSDVEAAIDLLEGHAALSRYAEELAYARGRLAYARGDDETARAQFEIVLTAGRVDLASSVAGHLLGVIGIRQKESPVVIQKRLQAAANIALEIRDQRGRQLILTTLVNHLLDAPVDISMPEIVDIAQEAADVADKYGDAMLAASTYTTLGQAQIRSGDHIAARTSFERAVDLSEQTGATERLKVALLSWSWLARKEGHSVEAAELVERALRCDIELGAAAFKNVRLTARRLKMLLGSVAHLPDEWQVIERSEQRLAYVRGDQLVIVAFTRDPGTLKLPSRAHGSWTDRYDGTSYEFGPTVEVEVVLAGRPGVVLDRTSR